MKSLLLCLALALATSARAQKPVPIVYLPAHNTLHFLSPEPIQYVDISGNKLIGDLPLKNVLRLKLRDSTSSGGALTAPISVPGFSDTLGTVITIAGEKFIAQYRLLTGRTDGPTEIDILPGDMRALDISGIGLSANQLKTCCMRLVTEKAKGAVSQVKAFGLSGRLNHVYTLGNYIFLDVSYRNYTNLRYDIEDLRFKVEDKRVTKASNVQSVELRPEFVLLATTAFARDYRNIFVFRKMSFPGNKQLIIDLSEKQVSGRFLTLKIAYHDILEADTLPN